MADLDVKPLLLALLGSNLNAQNSIESISPSFHDKPPHGLILKVAEQVETVNAPIGQWQPKSGGILRPQKQMSLSSPNWPKC